jgi:hypothetical protein
MLSKHTFVHVGRDTTLGEIQEELLQERMKVADYRDKRLVIWGIKSPVLAFSQTTIGCYELYHNEGFCGPFFDKKTPIRRGTLIAIEG